MGVYYHGEEEVAVNVYPSGKYIYTQKPDGPFLCQQCSSVLDIPYHFHRHMRTPSGMLVAETTTIETPLSSAVLSLPRKGPICHTCYLRIPAVQRSIFVKDEMLLHTVSQLLILCPNQEEGCSSVFKRGDLDMHINIDCAFQQVKCIFSKLGCTKDLQRRERRSHEQMCPWSSKLETILPFTIRELDRLSAVALETGKKTKVLNSWMEEVDMVLKELVEEKGLNRMELYHQRLFERTLTIPVELPLPGPSPNYGLKFIDMRASSLDLIMDNVPYIGLLEIIETVSLNRCLVTLTFRLSSDLTTQTFPIILTSLQRSLGSNTTLEHISMALEETQSWMLKLLYSNLELLQKTPGVLKSIHFYAPPTKDYSQFQTQVQELKSNVKKIEFRFSPLEELYEIKPTVTSVESSTITLGSSRFNTAQREATE